MPGRDVQVPLEEDVLEEPAGVFLDDLLGPVKLKNVLQPLGELGGAGLVGVGGPRRRVVHYFIELKAGPGFHFRAGFEHPAHDGCGPALGPGDLNARGEIGRRYWRCGVGRSRFLYVVVVWLGLEGLGRFDLVGEAGESRHGPKQAAFRDLSSMSAFRFGVGQAMPGEHCRPGEGVVCGRRRS